MPIDLAPLLAPQETAVVVFECQERIVGETSVLPGLAAAVREAGVIDRIAVLVASARDASVPVMYATIRPDPHAAPRPAATPLEHRLQREVGGDTAAPVDMGPVVDALAPRETDIVVERHVGLTGFHGSGLDVTLQHLGARQIVLVGVSLNVGIVGTAIEAVNRGYPVVVVSDCVAADPGEFAEPALRHSIRPVAFVATSAEVRAVWADARRDGEA